MSDEIKRIDQVMDVKILKQMLSGTDESKLNINYMPIGSVVVKDTENPPLSEIPTELLVSELLDRLPKERRLARLRDMAKMTAIFKTGTRQKAAEFLGLKSRRAMYIKE
jgi:hypothetical protein